MKCSHVGKRVVQASRASIYSAVFGNRSGYEIIKPRIRTKQKGGYVRGIYYRTCLHAVRMTFVENQRDSSWEGERETGERRLPKAYFNWK